MNNINKLLAALATVFLVGCETIPVVPGNEVIPAAPANLVQRCDPLTAPPKDVKEMTMGELMQLLTERDINYILCAIRYDRLIDARGGEIKLTK